MQKCNICKLYLDKDMFYVVKGKHIFRCKKCISDKQKIYLKANPDKVRQSKQKYKQNNRDKVNSSNREYYKQNVKLILEKQSNYKKEHPDKVNLAKIKYRLNNKEKCNKATIRCAKIRLANSPIHKMVKCLRDRVYHAVTYCSMKKHKKTLELLGCTASECYSYLESLFDKDMNWNNYGIKGWHMDHIIPCSFFDLTDPHQQIQCFHYTNLQPLWHYDNRHKNAKLPKDFKYRFWDGESGWITILYGA